MYAQDVSTRFLVQWPIFLIYYLVQIEVEADQLNDRVTNMYAQDSKFTESGMSTFNWRGKMREKERECVLPLLIFFNRGHEFWYVGQYILRTETGRIF